MAGETETEFTLAEFCKMTRLSEDRVSEFVGVGIIEPRMQRDYWVFSTREVSQSIRAERLMHDLELTPHGAALALDLMEQNRRLQRKLAYLEQLVSRLSS